MNRIVDFSENPVALSVRYDQLIIRTDNSEESIPLEEISAVVVSHPAVHYTHAVLAGICEHGGAFITCDRRRMPAGMLLPLESHSIQTERIAIQVSASVPVKKRIWKQIVVAKIRAQAALLQNEIGSDLGLREMARRIKSGDKDNAEARASRIYWPGLFGPEFIRKTIGGDGINSILNYGYAVVRAIVARAICAVGLHPSLGIHHHNRYDAFCLADDLVEPFRPLVDKAALETVRWKGPNPLLDKDSKSVLLQHILEYDFQADGQSRKLFDVVARVARSLVSVYDGSRQKLWMPTTF